MVHYAGASVTSQRTFERVRYPEIYPGIDLLFIARHGQMEYDFELRPGVDPRQIRIRYSGVKVHRAVGGALKIHGPGVVLAQNRPTALQAGPTGAQQIACEYAISDSREVTLRMGKYDPNLPLLIDPVLSFSTYLGGVSFDTASAAAADSNGNLYLAGETSSAAEALYPPDPAGMRLSRNLIAPAPNWFGWSIWGARNMIRPEESLWIQQAVSILPG